MSFDILFPYYGDVAYMRQAVLSVLAQTVPDWRLVVIDDGYPDDSVPEWFARLSALDPRVEYQRNEQNLGANGNYRKALTEVRNELAVVMGADDVMLPNYLETVLAAHQQFPDAAIIQPGVQVIDEQNRPAMGLVDQVKRAARPRGSGRRLLQGENLAASLVRGNWLYFPSVCWRSEPLVQTGFREGYDVVQDLGLALDIIRAGGSMVLDDTLCFQYRRHRASDSSWRALEGTRFVEERAFFNLLAQEFDKQGWPKAARAARQHVLSRLNAATLVPKAYRAGQREGMQTLMEHVVGRDR